MKRILNRTKLVLGLATGLLLFNTSCEKEKIAVTDITLNKTEVRVEISNIESLTAILTPTNATNKNITWESANEAIATVDANGVITGISLGSTTIKAIAQSDTTINTLCSVTVTPLTGEVITVSGNITENTKWYSNAKYQLSGFVYVKNNATLTIEPGTIIKGISGTKATLIIEKGAKIVAQGTATSPIVFTSDKPKGQRAYGDWGGLVICGNALTNKHDGGTGTGVAEGGIGSTYGGTIANDNSGVLQYVRIEFPGIPLTATSNSEINGLTLYAVGSGTTMDHIQVSYSGDDSYEWFGGNVNAKYLVALRGWDDDWDTDNGFTGKVQFFVSLRDPLSADQSQSNGFESDNDSDGSTITPITAPIFVNGSVFGPLATSSTTIHTLYRHAMQIRRGSRTSVYNSVFAGWPYGLFIDGQRGDSPAQATNNILQMENNVFAGMTSNYVSSYLTNSEAWFTLTTRSNEVKLTNDLLQLSSPFNLTNPNFLPATGSLLLTGASFTNSRLTDTFFTPVTHRGAFGTTNWTTGWCNFDPQNADY